MKKEDLLKYLILAILIYMPLFGHLGTLPIRIWDEARSALNAYEMLNDGDYIVTHFNGNPDLWNTKPPLLIWLQVLSMKIFGVSELALRLPSGLSALLTCLALLIFAHRFMKNSWYGFIVVMVLITTGGYVGDHATRTGDYDALLTLFTTSSGLFFFMFCEHNEKKHLYLFFLTLALAVLTKSVSGLLIVPGLIFYSLYQKKFLPLLKSKHFYIGMISAMGLVVSYYLLREANNPGYLSAVVDNELAHRFMNVIEDHRHGPFYYLQNLVDERLATWFILLPFGLFLGWISKDHMVKRVTVFSSFIVFAFLLTISLSGTKLAWYDVPLYPYLSMIIGISILYIFDLLGNVELKGWKFRTSSIPYLFLILVFILPYQNIFDKTYLPEELDSEKEFYEIGHYLQDAVKGAHDLEGQYLLYDGYNLHNLFYLHLLNDKGMNLDLADWQDLDSSMVVFAHQEHIKDYVENTYVFDMVSEDSGVRTYRISGLKKE